jgi:hypothetical protein
MKTIGDLKRAIPGALARVVVVLPAMVIALSLGVSAPAQAVTPTAPTPGTNAAVATNTNQPAVVDLESQLNLLTAPAATASNTATADTGSCSLPSCTAAALAVQVNQFTGSTPTGAEAATATVGSGCQIVCTSLAVALTLHIVSKTAGPAFSVLTNSVCAPPCLGAVAIPFVGFYANAAAGCQALFCGFISEARGFAVAVTYTSVIAVDDPQVLPPAVRGLIGELKAKTAELSHLPNLTADRVQAVFTQIFTKYSSSITHLLDTLQVQRTQSP